LRRLRFLRRHDRNRRVAPGLSLRFTPVRRDRARRVVLRWLRARRPGATTT